MSAFRHLLGSDGTETEHGSVTQKSLLHVVRFGLLLNDAAAKDL